jgi:hypothetical protein
VIDDDRLAVLDLLRYIKNYQGLLIRRDGASTPDYRFSDEREWRYVPAYDKDFEMILEDRLYQRDEIRELVNEKISPFRLGFHADDVRYIIVKENSEINDLVNYLKAIKHPRYSPRVVERLITRILTRDQIMGDF